MFRKISAIPSSVGQYTVSTEFRSRDIFRSPERSRRSAAPAALRRYTPNNGSGRPSLRKTAASGSLPVSDTLEISRRSISAASLLRYGMSTALTERSSASVCRNADKIPAIGPLSSKKSQIGSALSGRGSRNCRRLGEPTDNKIRSASPDRFQNRTARARSVSPSTRISAFSLPILLDFPPARISA